MTGSAMVWKKGRGKLEIFQPLLGTWRAKAESPMRVVVCTRTFSKVLDGAYIQLEAQWGFEQGAYEEIVFIGTDPEGDRALREGRYQRSSPQILVFTYYPGNRVWR